MATFLDALNETLTSSTALAGPMPANLRSAAGLNDGALSGFLTANLTASRALVSGAGGKLAASAVTATEQGYLSGVTSALQTQIDSKASSADMTAQLALKAPINNPTFTGTVSGVTKAMVGLGNADNTSDANKPVSTATQTALDLKAPLASPTFTGTVSGITKAMVGLGNVDNTSDANKPVSTAVQMALELKANVDDMVEALLLKLTTTDLIGAPNATAGVDTVLALKSGAFRKTVLPFVTPEMHGAAGDGAADDLIPLTNAISEARSLGIPMIGRGFYFITAPLEIERPSGVEYWDGATEQRPISIYIEKLKTSSIDAAVIILGSAISDRVHIGHIIGPGYGAIGTPGGTDERIGVRITGSVDFKLGSATDFNFGVVLQECFSSEIQIGYILACIKGLYARVMPGDVNGTNQSNHISIRNPGGVYTNEGFPNDALRRARSCDVGIHFASMHGSVIDMGAAQYCQQETDSVAVILDAGVTKNEMWVYLEGARDDGEFFQCAGHNNTIHFSGLGTPSNVKLGAIRVTGVGNDIYGLGDVVGAAEKAAFAPQGSFGIIQINPGNTVHGKYRQKVQKAPSILRLNLLTDATAFTASSGSLTVTTSTSDVPAGHDFKESYEFTVPDSNTYWYTSGNITVTSETLETVRIKTAVRGITNHPKIAFYLLTSSGTLLDGNQSVTTDPDDPDWSIIEYLADIGSGLTNILFRYSIRNVSPGETGGVLRACRPLISFNLDHPLVRTNDVMLSGRGIWADHIPKNIYNYQGFSYRPQTITDIVGTAIDVNSRAHAIITGAATGTDVNLINNLIENQPTMIINKSGSSITFTTAAGAWTSSIVLADQEAMTVIKTTGNSLFAADVWRVG